MEKFNANTVNADTAQGKDNPNRANVLSKALDINKSRSIYFLCYFMHIFYFLFLDLEILLNTTRYYSINLRENVSGSIFTIFPEYPRSRELLLVYPFSSLGWRYGANSNPGSRH